MVLCRKCDRRGIMIGEVMNHVTPKVIAVIDRFLNSSEYVNQGKRDWPEQASQPLSPQWKILFSQ